MKHFPRIIPCFVLALALSGCVTAPQTRQQQIVSAKRAATLAATSLTQAVKAGVFNEEEKAVVRGLAQTTDLSIKAMETADQVGDESAFRTAKRTFDAVIDRLIEQKIEAEKRKAPPS